MRKWNGWIAIAQVYSGSEGLFVVGSVTPWMKGYKVGERRPTAIEAEKETEQLSHVE